MVSAPTPALIASLLEGSIRERLVALKSVRAGLSGNDQRKSAAVKCGLVGALASILTDANLRAQNAVHDVSANLSPDEQEVRLVATLLTALLASGGCAFLAPLCAADLPTILAESLLYDPTQQLATAALHALQILTSFWCIQDTNAVQYSFWSAVFSNRSLQFFDVILSFPVHDNSQQLKFVCELISMLPPSQSLAVVQYGILDKLAALLVSHTLEKGFVRCQPSSNSYFPEPPHHSTVPSILTAAFNLVADSNYRAHCFIFSKHVKALFAQSGVDLASFGPAQGFAGNGSDAVLSQIYVSHSRTVPQPPASNHFPALRSTQSSQPGSGAGNPQELVLDVDHVNAVCSWLLALVRTSREDAYKLPALGLLASVAGAIDADPLGPVQKTEMHQKKTRERVRQMNNLALPLIVTIIGKAIDGKSPYTGAPSDLPAATSRQLREKSCSILALLIQNNRELQDGAKEGQAIKQLCAMLKKTFENVTLAKPMWSPNPQSGPNPSLQGSCLMGPAGFPLEILHAMRCRQGALEAIAAIAAYSDDHRKAVMDAGAVTYIIDSLKPFSPSAITDAFRNRLQPMPKDGNTTPVILAACRAARSLSRSVSILRTTLLDNGIAKPIVQLLHHPSLEVQIAATDVCCNLAADFSPQRTDLEDSDILTTLVAHAHDSSRALRHSSLWALKHLVLDHPKDFKLHALERLGTEWLVSVIQGNAASAVNGGGVSVGMSSANAAGEQIDLLNPSTMDLDLPGFQTANTMGDEDEDGEVLYDESSSTHYQASQLRSTLNNAAPAFNAKKYLAAIREIEQSEEYAASRDEVGIQIQALDLVRNFMTGPEDNICSQLVDQIGNARLIDLLISKLSPVPHLASAGRTTYHPSGLILSTVHVVGNLAGASPRHRDMLASHPLLWQAVRTHCTHHDHTIRVMVTFAIQNLLNVSETSDKPNAMQRYQKLKAAGIDSAIRNMAADPVIDVRERVKSLIRLLDQLV